MTDAAERYALIGAGNLGGPLAARIIEQGFELTVCDRDQKRLAELGAKGAQTTTSVADCIEADSVIVLVASADQFAGVIRELATALGAASATARLARVAVMSTVPAQAVRDAQDVLQPHGVRVLDAPVSGGAVRAETGDLTVMAGGPSDLLDEFAPMFDAVARHVFHCGDLGAGQMTKVANNVVCHANMTLTAEVLRLAASHGLDTDAVLRVMEVSSGRNWLTQDPAFARALYADHTTDRDVCEGILSVYKKDTAIAAALAEQEEAAFPMIMGLARLVSRLGEETCETWEKIAAEPEDNG